MPRRADIRANNAPRNSQESPTPVTSQSTAARRPDGPDEIDASYSWLRLVISVALTTVSSVGMWSIMVALPTVQAEFGAARAEATLPFTMVMVGFAGGGVVMGRLADRFGIAAPASCGIVALTLGYLGAGASASLWQFAAAHLLIGLGASSTFGPLMADISYWFARWRGVAVSVCASGNYLAGAIWPPIVHHMIAGYGWRTTHIAVGIFCAVSTPALIFLLRRRPAAGVVVTAPGSGGSRGTLGTSPMTLMVLISLAGVACCVAMSMPQVHIVAYCGDLGYGVARGAEMLSLMMGFGIVSRIASGFIADRIGGLGTLLLGSFLQGVALFLYLLFDGLTSLYVISALFGLFQGGIVPSYAIIIREYFPANEAGARVGIVLMATLFGMALGGWMSGAIFDLTGSYRAAFMNGLLWNLLNVAIVLWLLSRPRLRLATA
jgi:MFS family permease